MPIYIGINGMGIVGREIFKMVHQYAFDENPKFKCVCINDPYISPENLAYLLRYDSIYHDYDPKVMGEVAGDDSNGQLRFPGTDKATGQSKEIRYTLYSVKDPQDMPLGENGVEYMIDCTGLYPTAEKCLGFIHAGARKVICPYLHNNQSPHLVYGVNHDKYDPNLTFVSVPPMSIQVLAKLAKVINDYSPIEYGWATNYSSYTNVQTMMDSYMGYDNLPYEQGRAGAWNIIPYGTGLGKPVGLIVPELNGKLNGCEYRAPIIGGGFVDLLCKMPKEPDISTGTISAMLKASSDSLLQIPEAPVVTSDVLGLESAQVYTGWSTSTISPELLHVCAAYDGIRGLARQTIRLLEHMVYVDRR